MKRGRGTPSAGAKRNGIEMDIGMAGVALGVFSVTALVGVYAQMSGRNLKYKMFPPDRIGLLVPGALLVFLIAYLETSGGVADLSLWSVALFIVSTSASSASGYMVGYIGMAWIRADGDDHHHECEHCRRIKRDDKRDGEED